MPEIAGLVQAAAALLPGSVHLAQADPRQRHPLLSGEDLPGAIPARLNEFSAGRHAARLALAALGRTPVAIGMAPDRAPVWPAGVTGSITHSRDACLAGVAASSALRGLGLDLEEATALDRDLWDSVLLPSEQLWLARQPQATRGLLAKVVFSAKEAAYKAQYAVSRALFGFDTLLVELREDSFTARFRQDVPGFAEGDELRGRWAWHGALLLTAVALA